MRLLNSIERVNLFFTLMCIPLATCWKVHDPNIAKQLLFEISVLFWIFLYFVKIVKIKQFLIPQNQLSYGVILFLLLAGLSLILSTYVKFGSIRLELIAYFIIFFFLISQLINDHKDALFVLKVVSFGSFIISCFGGFSIFWDKLFSCPTRSFKGIRDIGPSKFPCRLVCVYLAPYRRPFFIVSKAKKKMFLCLIYCCSSCVPVFYPQPRSGHWFS